MGGDGKNYYQPPQSIQKDLDKLLCFSKKLFAYMENRDQEALANLLARSIQAANPVENTK